jgi:hypothetical protein
MNFRSVGAARGVISISAIDWDGASAAQPQNAAPGEADQEQENAGTELFTGQAP